MSLVACPYCGITMDESGLAGQLVACPKCAGQFMMPDNVPSKAPIISTVSHRSAVRRKRSESAWPYIVALSAVAIPILGCGIICSGALSEDKRQSDEQSAPSRSPYRFVASKVDPRSNRRDVMELYAFSGPIDVSTLKAFCRSRKQKCNADGFFFVVLFDDVENASFPTVPFSASYGEDQSGRVLRHIRAIYTYNRSNGFSELTHYQENAWESVPQVVKVP